VQDEKFIGVDFDLAVQAGVVTSVDKVVVNDWRKRRMWRRCGGAAWN